MSFRILAATLILLLSACAHNNQVVIPAKDIETSLIFIEGNKAASLLAPYPSTKDDLVAYDEDEKLVKELCGATTKSVEAVPVLALAWLAEKGIAFVVDQVDKSLQEEISKYTAAFSGSNRINFYQPNAKNGPALAYNCFRLSARYKQSGEESEKVAMDFIGHISMSGSDALLVTPLRLYYKKSQADTNSSGIIGVSINLRLDAYWREYNKGESKLGAFDQTILTEKINLGSGKSFYKNYINHDIKKRAEELNKLTKVGPLVSFTMDDKTAFGSNQTVATISVVEVGNPPWLLKQVANLFNDNKDKIKNQIKEAIDKATSNLEEDGK